MFIATVCVRMAALPPRQQIVVYFLAMLSVRYALRLRSSPLSFKSLRISRLFSTKNGDSDNNAGHQSGSDSSSLADKDKEYLEILQSHQSSAPRLSLAEEVRTMITSSSGHGVISTNSLQFPGYPTGSIVAFELDDDGLPFFSLSTMSAHTRDLVADGRASLVVTAPDFKTLAEGRISMVGQVTKVIDEDKRTSMREKYLKRHPDSYWVDFGDFGYFKMTSVESVRYVGGFARAGSVTALEYSNALPDPLAPFARPVMQHMNEDHADSIVAMIQHYVGVPVTEAQIVSLDRLGMMVKAKLAFAGGGYSKIRLPFVREVRERKAVKDVIVEMTRASASH